MSVFNELLKSDKINFKPENARSTDTYMKKIVLKKMNLNILGLIKHTCVAGTANNTIASLCNSGLLFIKFFQYSTIFVE